MTILDLPARLPVGTRYVVEGRPGKRGELRIVSRQVIMPNGQAIDLKAGIVSFERPRAAVARLKDRGRQRRAKKT